MRVSAFAILASLGIASSALPTITFAQAAPAAGEEPDVVVVTGTRVAARSALDTAVAVDVVTADALTSSGTTEVSQALSQNVPSFNFPRPGLADGTDTIRPATLRGLAPDQTLVLVNSKRRHTASLVNVNGTVGRGSSAVDMNTIPTGIIQSVEVLRDGASAQYGSDAIAGVINVRLKERTDGGALTISYGERRTTVSTLVDNPVTTAGTPAVNPNWSVANLAEYDRTDGETLTLGAWAGVPLGDAGFLTVAAEYLVAEKTVRTAPDWRQQYNLVNGAFDPREATINRYNAWYGEPEVDQFTVFGNAGINLSDTVELYAWASMQNRLAVSGGFFRRANDARNTAAIYPDGFLPLISPEVIDKSGAVGIRWEAGNWDFDASAVYGSNTMDFTIRNTLNRSLGVGSNTFFDAGGYGIDQTTVNFSGVTEIEMGLASPLNLAVGVEARRETYDIRAGEPDSYRLGPAGGAAGAQVFPGFQPSNVVDVDRSAIGAYIDLEANITDRLLASIAVRAENYSDFGGTVAGKIAARYDFSDNFAIRGSIQNGFRAPSLQQQFFTATSTNFINGIPFEIGTFPATSPVARALGGQPLEAEKSLNFAAGAVMRFGALAVTVDAYRINMEDRIVLSENLTGAAVVALLNAANVNATGGRFFINGVDTESTGVDIVASWRVPTDTMGRFNFTFGANLNQTEVTRLPTVQVLPGAVLFGRVNTLTFEEGTPKDKYIGAVDWTFGAFDVNLRATRYGEVLSPGTTAATDLVLDPRVLFDIEGGVNIGENWRFAAGVDNITDEYPTQSPVALNTTSNTPFSNYSPFGRSGRYVYGKISFNW
jgi:iron complex outermembrane recepter protein